MCLGRRQKFACRTAADVLLFGDRVEFADSSIGPDIVCVEDSEERVTAGCMIMPRYLQACRSSASREKEKGKSDVGDH